MTRVIEVSESGTLVIPRELVGNARPHTQYEVEADGEVLLLRRTGEERSKVSVTGREWSPLAEEIGRAWKSEKSAAEVVSEMRR